MCVTSTGIQGMVKHQDFIPQVPPCLVLQALPLASTDATLTFASDKIRTFHLHTDRPPTPRYSLNFFGDTYELDCAYPGEQDPCFRDKLEKSRIEKELQR